MSKTIFDRNWDSLTQFINQYIKPNNIEYKFDGVNVITLDTIYGLVHGKLTTRLNKQ